MDDSGAPRLFTRVISIIQAIFTGRCFGIFHNKTHEFKRGKTP